MQKSMKIGTKPICLQRKVFTKPLPPFKPADCGYKVKGAKDTEERKVPNFNRKPKNYVNIEENLNGLQDFYNDIVPPNKLKS
jgi:hypothetical protein